MFKLTIRFDYQLFANEFRVIFLAATQGFVVFSPVSLRPFLTHELRIAGIASGLVAHLFRLRVDVRNR